MVFSRREFVKGSLSALGFLALDGLPVFAAPKGWTPTKKPNLVFGILSDTHLMVEWDGKSLYRTMSFDYVRNAFKLFKKRNVDAFVHLGDAAHRGCVREWEFHKELFEKVFGKRGGPAKIIVVGNHELFGNAGHCRGVYRDQKVWEENAICADVKRHYERIWGEPYSEFFHREINGCHFFGRHWVSEEEEYKGTREQPFADYILSRAESCSLQGTKPFFILSHRRHHFRFCNALRGFPNAVAFFGHWHASNADWKTIYFDSFGGFFPSVQVGACRFDGGNALGNALDANESVLSDKTMDAGQGWHPNKVQSRQAMIVNVLDDCIVFERHEVGQGGKLGPDWVLPLNWEREFASDKASASAEAIADKSADKPGDGERGKHPFSRAELKKVIGAPEFGRGVKLKFGKSADGLKVTIPLANGNPDSRVFAYDVEIAGDDPEKRLVKSAYFEGCNLGIGHEPNKGVTLLDIPKKELPESKILTIAITPLSSLGTKGNPLVVAYSTVSGSVMPKKVGIGGREKTWKQKP